MFRHHLLLIYRNFRRYKNSFFINLIGLSTGISCALLIYLWVNDEMKMDRFHNDRLYQVMANENITEGVNTVDATPGILAETMVKEMPEVESAVTASPTYWLGKSSVSTNNKTAIKAAGKFAGADFFKIFSYPLLVGKADQVLKDKNTVVISEELALKLFRSTDVIGKEFLWRNADMKSDNHALISGVFKDIRGNSSDHFDFLVSLDVFFAAAPNYLKWGNSGPNTFFILKEGADPLQFNAKIKGFLKTKGQTNISLFIRPYGDSYLYSKFENGKVAGGRIDYVKLFSLIAVFILLIACINFMNLSTAKASRRLKEVGVKKVMGAQRSSLILQYMAESMLLTVMAVFVSLLAVELLLPQFNTIVDKQLSLHYSVPLILALLGITVFTGLIAGSYPAFYLSGLKPALALKGRLNLTQGALWTRQGLVVFQFTLSVILIVAVLVIYKQIEYVQHKNQGYQRDNVLYFEAAGKFKNNINFAIDAIKKMPGVINASSIDRELLGDLNYTFGDFNWEGRDPKEVIKFQRADVNSGLFETLGIKMAEGRSFSDKFRSDTSKIIVNEAGIKVMRLKNPVGKVFNIWGTDFQIIGVIKDFHFESLHQTIKPMFFKYRPQYTNRIMVNVSAGKLKEVIDGLQRMNATYNPGYNMDIKFLDQDFQAQYVAESRVALLSRYFAAIAVVISCLGLFGLATFTAERRLKEIGIRKVLGASGLHVVYTLSKDFTKPVVAAILIAIPISYVLTQNWLNSFAYRIELRLWYFVAAGFLALLISVVTVLTQALRAANVNPVQCLKADG
ncbi:ABC transporter permease [Pedobacter nyackensis]|uniref:ABC transporter permease n=1 Tax=Pedobacter nyackensis TaxID=475255 RepID=UPI00292DD174|nr:ABC transporter permease [Pedobacter nyackensis]